jgi:hypothetical protein
MPSYNKKATALYFKAEVTEGVAVTPLATDVLAITAADIKDTFSNQTEEFAGDELSREVFVYETDATTAPEGNIFLPARGNVVLANIGAFIPGPLFSACGMNPTLTGTTLADQVVTLSNNVPTTTTLTTQVRFATNDEAFDYVRETVGARGTLDLDVAVGSVAKMKMMLMGSYKVPTKSAKITPNYGTQRDLARLSPIWKDTNTICCEMSPQTGAYTAHAGIAGTVKNICVNKISGTNVSGFTLTRELNSCNSRFTRTATASDITLTVKLDSPDPTSITFYNPPAHMYESHRFSLRYGSAQGQRLGFSFTSLILKGYSYTTVGDTRYLDLTFTNAGFTTITLS